MGASHATVRLLKKRKTTRKIARLAEQRQKEASPAKKATPAKRTAPPKKTEAAAKKADATAKKK